jgi:TonB-linked SusC/RagA family outer membrane protein
MKYFADFTLSYSGTNLLNKDSRYGLFPALSLAWKLSNEDWFANNGFVNDLKIRASWGMTGNDLSIPQDLSAVKFSGSGTYYFTNNSTASGGLNQGRLPSTGATFETSTKSNIGIDVSMFGMLDLNADAFYDHRTNILMESEGLISSVIGVLKPYQTSGIVDNKGVELGINLHNNKGEFTYNVGGQFSYVKNKIIEMGEVYRPYDYLKRTGQSIDQAFGLEAAGFFLSKYEISVYPKQLFSAVNPGDIRYKNQNKDNVINIYDEVPLGYSTRNPELYFSASLGLGYKGFGLDALFQGIANKSVYLNTTSIFWPLRGNTSISDFSDNRWTATTTETATLPRLTTLENVNNFRPNDIWITDGSYLKLRSLEIYYDLPHQLISRLKISDTRLFIRGMDLFSIDHIDIVDPEAIGLVYPICSSYSIGIKIGF